MHQGRNTLIALFLTCTNGAVSPAHNYFMVGLLGGYTRFYLSGHPYTKYFQSTFTAFGNGEKQGALLFFQKEKNSIPLTVSQEDGIGSALLKKSRRARLGKSPQRDGFGNGPVCTVLH